MNRYSIGSILGILLLWELLVRWLEIPKYLLPTPTTIIAYIIAKFQLLANHTLMTLLEAGVGFIVGSFSDAPTEARALKVGPKTGKKTQMMAVTTLDPIPLPKMITMGAAMATIGVLFRITA